jgi:hypothetical protein
MKVKHWCTGEVTDMPISDLIVENINSLHDHSGQLELMERKLEVLTRAFGLLVEHIGEGAAAKVIEDMSCPNYKVAK